jgi:hypothetical protein
MNRIDEAQARLERLSRLLDRYDSLLNDLHSVDSPSSALPANQVSATSVTSSPIREVNPCASASVTLPKTDNKPAAPHADKQPVAMQLETPLSSMSHKEIEHFFLERESATQPEGDPIRPVTKKSPTSQLPEQTPLAPRPAVTQFSVRPPSILKDAERTTPAKESLEESGLPPQEQVAQTLIAHEVPLAESSIKTIPMQSVIGTAHTEQIIEAVSVQPSTKPTPVEPVINERQLRALSRKHLMMMIYDLQEELIRAQEEKQTLIAAYKAGVAQGPQTDTGA